MNLSSRVTRLNKANDNKKGRYILYWMQIFGTIRYMTSRSMAKKFRANHYMAMVSDGLQKRQRVLWP